MHVNFSPYNWNWNTFCERRTLLTGPSINPTLGQKKLLTRFKNFRYNNDVHTDKDENKFIEAERWDVNNVEKGAMRNEAMIGPYKDNV